MSVVLSEHLPLLATAPDGIKKLRGLILDLAVRGKLVPQDPSDEPASKLLKQIAKERARLEAEGICKKSKSTSAVCEDEQPFAVPNGWEWVRVANFGETQTGTTPSKSQPCLFGSDVPFIKPGDISDQGINYENEGLSSEGVANSGRLAFAGSILMVCIGTIGKCGVIDRKCSFNQQINSISPAAGTSPFVFTAMRSNYFQSEAWSRSSSTTIAILNKGNWEAIPLPLPPLAEQHRIVAKVDELMALCDRLEVEQVESASAHAKLVETLLGTLSQSTDAADLATNWQRLAEHFETLFTTEVSINVLKQTILQLAVMGKLVPQDPNDVPANEVLQQIAKERGHMEGNGGYKKSKQITSEGEGEQPFDVPTGWVWASLGVIAPKITDGEHISPKKTQSGMMLLTAKHILENGVSLDDPQYVAIEDGVRFRERCGPTVGDVLICSRGTIGRCCVVTLDAVFCLMGSVILVRPASQLLPTYLNDFLKSEIGQHFIRGATKGMAVNALYLKDIRQCMVPLPPLAEQHRIVGKVEELMALCDRLKADLTTAREQEATLADTLIESALEAA